MRAASDPLAACQAVVLLIDLEALPAAAEEPLRTAFGLTPAEARVAALLGSDLPPRDAAEKLGIGEETGRDAQTWLRQGGRVAPERTRGAGDRFVVRRA